MVSVLAVEISRLPSPLHASDRSSLAWARQPVIFR